MPSGRITASASSVRRIIPSTMPMTANEVSPMKMLGRTSTRLMLSCVAASAPRTTTRSAPTVMPDVEESTGYHRPALRLQEAGRRRDHRDVEEVRTGRVDERDAADPVLAEIHRRHGGGPCDAAEPGHPGSHVPGQRGLRDLVGREPVARGTEHDPGGGDLVEALGDLAGGGLAEAQGRDQGSDTHDGADHGQHEPGRPRADPEQRLVDQIDSPKSGSDHGHRRGPGNRGKHQDVGTTAGVDRVSDAQSGSSGCSRGSR